MLTSSGPKVLEFNVRFGDPETQVVLPRWLGDVTSVLAAAAGGRLDSVEQPRFSADAAVCVILAAPGYPDAPRTGDRIDGFMPAGAIEGIDLYAAGVGRAGDDLVTSGGRVLGMGASGPTISAARKKVYEAIPVVSWPEVGYRKDIAAEAAAREGNMSREGNM
jgi:phosphoribosylamine--glycine ligase